MTTYRRIYAIPDVHGRSDLLDQALTLIEVDGWNPLEDRLVFLGDMIDRGPDSKGVLDTIKKLVEMDRATALRGNHEDFAVDFYVKHSAHAKENWDWNGGIETRKSYPTGNMSEEHYRWLASLPYSLELQGFFFSHAPVPREKQRASSGYTPGRSLNGAPYSKDDLTWTYFGTECERPGAMMDVHEGPLSMGGIGTEHLIGLCGHIHRGPKVPEVRIYPNYRMLDCGSGCFPSGALAIHECISGRTLYARPMEEK